MPLQFNPQQRLIHPKALKKEAGACRDELARDFLGQQTAPRRLSLCLSFSVESSHLVKGSHLSHSISQNVDFVIWMRAQVLGEIKRGEIRLGNTPRFSLHIRTLYAIRDGVKAGEVSV